MLFWMDFRLPEPTHQLSADVDIIVLQGTPSCPMKFLGRYNRHIKSRPTVVGGTCHGVVTGWFSRSCLDSNLGMKPRLAVRTEHAGCSWYSSSEKECPRCTPLATHATCANVYQEKLRCLWNGSIELATNETGCWFLPWNPLLLQQSLLGRLALAVHTGVLDYTWWRTVGISQS
eukprot:1512022-Amphidinium_carterae.2